MKVRVPYRDESAFVRGQKIKLALAAVILIVMALRAWLTGEAFLQ